MTRLKNRFGTASNVANICSYRSVDVVPGGTQTHLQLRHFHKQRQRIPYCQESGDDSRVFRGYGPAI
jgi:hypothetical protein